MNLNEINVITLAYLGDAVYELSVRERLLEKSIGKVKDIWKESLKYVSAKSQADILNKMIENNILTEEELDIVKRGRNNKRGYHPKNTDVITYKLATGFETLIGYLYLSNKNRLNEILESIEVE